MSRIKRKFEELKRTGGQGFIPFITAGDPDLDLTCDLIPELADAGASVIELGVPFTDPMADGPVIQRSSQRSLDHGAGGIRQILDTVAKARIRTEVPIVLFGYLNPFLRYGLEELAGDCVNAGVDGLLVTDIVGLEFQRISRLFGTHGLDLISLVAPTTTDVRLEEITAAARGFVYAVARTGVTGKGADSTRSARKLVSRVRSFTRLPVAVGFGISTRQDVLEVSSYADAAVVGSAIVAIMENAGQRGEIRPAVRSFVDGLLGG